MPGLGGKQHLPVIAENNPVNNKPFMHYTRYMETTSFKTAIDMLQKIATVEPIACMCAEAIPIAHGSLIF